MRIRSIQIKFLLTLLIPLLIGGVSLSGLFAYLTAARFEAQLEKKQTQYAAFHETAISYALWHYDLRSIDHIIQALSFDPDLIRIAVKDSSGKVVGEIDKTGGEFPDDAHIVRRAVRFDEAAPERVLGKIVLVFDDSRIMADVHRQVVRDSALMGLLILAIALSALAAHRWLVDRPLQSFFGAFQQTRADGILHRVTKIADDEIGTVADAYNRMLDRIAADEAELTRAKEEAEAATQAKADFLANVSHEIRTPMNAILGMTRLMGQTQMTATQRDYLNKIGTSNQHLLVVLNDILDFSKIEAGKVEFENTAFALSGVLGNVADMTRPAAVEKGLDLHFRTGATVPEMLQGDPHRIEQVLLNITSNAIKFTETGNIEVRTEVAEDHGASVDLRITVTDTGVGMDAATQQGLFQPFSQADTSITRRFGGTGLGLSICHRLVALMNGRIAIDSAPHQGTAVTVTLTLRRAAAHATAETGTVRRQPRPTTDIVRVTDAGRDEAPLPGGATALTEAERAQLRGRTVLLVEDNAINQQVVRELLENAGLRVRLAADGQRGLEEAVNVTPDLILMDIQMPTMDGYAATAALRADPNLRHKPVVALTAHAMHGDRERCLDADMDDYLNKPIEDMELYRMLLKWLPVRDVTDTPTPGGQAAGAAEHADPALEHPETPPADNGGEQTGLPENLPGIDIATGLRYTAQQPALYRRMAERFTERYAEGVKDLQADLDAGRIAEAHRWAHSLKTLAAMLGANELREIAAETEHRLAQEDAAADLDLSDLAAEIARIRESLMQVSQ